MTCRHRAYNYELLLTRAIADGNETLFMSVLNKILDEAITVLEPWMDKVQRPMLESTRQKYADKGIDTSWQLRDPHDALHFSHAARDADIPDQLKRAALLVRLCTGNDRRPHIINLTVNVYRELDAAKERNTLLNANIQKNAKAAQRKEELRRYWQNEIDPKWSAPRAAEKLMKSDVYATYKPGPKKSMLERYVREWQALPDELG